MADNAANSATAGSMYVMPSCTGSPSA